MNMFKWIFSVENSENKTHKVITILGIKLKFKRKQKSLYSNIDFNAPVNTFGIINTNKDVVVLGNGPSLKDTFNNEEKLRFIKEKDIFVVNSFVNDNMFYILKPKYLCFMDPKFWATERCATIKKSHDIILEKLSKVTWNLIIFMPSQARETNVFKTLIKENKFIQFIYINSSCPKIEDENIRHSMYKQNLAMPRPQNVLVACLYLAINLNYKNIFLFGADHSWHLDLIVNQNNVLCLEDKHFYDNGKVAYRPFYKDAKQTVCWSIKEIFEAFMYIHESYEILEKYSSYMGAKIYNLSDFSCIDAFDRNFNIEEGKGCNAQ